MKDMLVLMSRMKIGQMSYSARQCFPLCKSLKRAGYSFNEMEPWPLLNTIPAME